MDTILLDPAVQRLVGDTATGKVVVLTGAGISAESGIPTFRGEEGYWVAQGRNYQPMELATREAFSRDPRLVWSWYLYRRGICRAAVPNPAHTALARLEAAVGDDFTLVTQNVDGLHRRAGNTTTRTYAIHGDIDRMRCFAECNLAPRPIPAEIPLAFGKGQALSDAEVERLRCPVCHGLARPHILWFDECYDEPRFRFESSLQAVTRADLLVVVGTAGATNLPTQIVDLALRQGTSVVALNLDPSPFTQRAASSPHGAAQLAPAGELVPALVDTLLTARGTTTPA